MRNLQLEDFHTQSYQFFPLYYLLKKTLVEIAEKYGEKDEASINQNFCDENRPIFDGVHMIWLQ